MNGSAIVRALDALGAVSGNLGIPGGGVSFYFKRRGAFDTSFLDEDAAAHDLRAAPRAGDPRGEGPAGPRRLGDGGKPRRDAARTRRRSRARSRRASSSSSSTPFLTDTAPPRAPSSCPTTTLVEDDDLLGAYGHHWLGASTPVVAPPPGVKSDLEIVQALASGDRRKNGRRGREDFCEGKRDRPGVEGAAALASRAAGRHAWSGSSASPSGTLSRKRFSSRAQVPAPTRAG